MIRNRRVIGKCRSPVKSDRTRFNRKLFIGGLALAILMLFICTCSADDGTSLKPTIVPNSLNEKIPDVGASQVSAGDRSLNYHFNQRAGKPVPQAEKEAAAERFKALYNSVKTRKGTRSAMDPGGIPHYFGPYPNYANSPMPKGPVASITLNAGGTGYSATPTVTITDVYETGTGATASVTVVAGTVTGITLLTPGTGYTAPIVNISDATGTGATASAVINPSTGGIRKFVDSVAGLNAGGKNNLNSYIPVAIPDTTSYPAGGNGYTSAPTVTITDSTGTGATATATVAGGKVTGVTINTPGSGYSANPVVSFSGGGATTNALGMPTVTGGAITGITLVGADYYEIELGQFSQKMHSDLPDRKSVV